MDYHQQPLTQKRETIMAMLSSLKESHDVFAQLHQNLTRITDVPENIYDEMHDTIITMGQELDTAHKQHAQNALQKAQSIIQRLHAQEAAERAQENPDDLLKDL